MLISKKKKKIKNHTDPNFKAVIRTESVKERGQKMRCTLTDIMWNAKIINHNKQGNNTRGDGKEEIVAIFLCFLLVKERMKLFGKSGKRCFWIVSLGWCCPPWSGWDDVCLCVCGTSVSLSGGPVPQWG